MPDDKGNKEVREALRTTFINGCMIAERHSFQMLDEQMRRVVPKEIYDKCLQYPFDFVVSTPLERHHAGFPVLPVAAFEDGSRRLLRSHPATSDRIGALLSLAY